MYSGSYVRTYYVCASLSLPPFLSVCCVCVCDNVPLSVYSNHSLLMSLLLKFLPTSPLLLRVTKETRSSPSVLGDR